MDLCLFCGVLAFAGGWMARSGVRWMGLWEVGGAIRE